MFPCPGEVYWATVGYKKRPVLIVSREVLNRGSYVVAIPFTSARLAERSSLRNCVLFGAGQFGLTRDCVAQAEAIAMIERSQLDPNPVSCLPPEIMTGVIRAVGYVLEAQCQPD